MHAHINEQLHKMFITYITVLNNEHFNFSTILSIANHVTYERHKINFKIKVKL